MNSGIRIGEAAMQLLDRTYADTQPTIWQATDRLAHINGTKAELLEAIAYLALQVTAYRRIANQDAALAIQQIETIVRNYRERRPEEEVDQVGA